VYESHEFTQNSCKKYKYDELKDNKQGSKNYINSMDNILINGKKQSDFLASKKYISDKKRKSFTGLNLPDGSNEINNNSDIKSADRKLSSHINAVVFIDKLKKNMNNFANNYEKENQKEKEGLRSNYNRKSFMK